MAFSLNTLFPDGEGPRILSEEVVVGGDTASRVAQFFLVWFAFPTKCTPNGLACEQHTRVCVEPFATDAVAQAKLQNAAHRSTNEYVLIAQNMRIERMGDLTKVCSTTFAAACALSNACHSPFPSQTKFGS